MTSSSSNALQLLSAYSDESSQSDDSDAEPKSKVVKTQNETVQRLPLPDRFLEIKQAVIDVKPDDDAEKHEGRKRSFPHERGNWATYIFIPYEASSTFDVLCDSIIGLYEPNITLKRIKDPHISLTKTFVLLHHWIDQLMAVLRDGLKYYPRFFVEFDGISAYTNEEKTRTFLSFDVNLGNNELKNSLSILEKCLEDYRLHPFFEAQVFHMSVAWCLGDVKSELEKRFTSVKAIIEDFKQSNDDVLSVNVDNYLCKTGHREYKFNLAPT